MLTIPSFRRIGDVTVYQDDAVWNRFYLLPALPSIRRDQNDRPVFLIASYHISDQARAEDDSLPHGGGYMNFDVQYAVTEAERDAARQELQTWVDQEYARRKASREFASLPEFSGADAPPVEFADPLLSGGTVSMLTTQSDLLVTDRFAEAPASLVSGSTAVFNVDLTAHGAEFMHDLMVDSDGTGNVDLTPVQVIYDLRMWARVPPVKIKVTGDSERIHKTMQKISETNRDNPCTPKEVETYRETGVNSSSLKETGAVEVVVDQGNAVVPDDVVTALQEYALDLFDTMVKERFLVPAEADTDDLDFDRDDPEMHDADEGWAARLYTGTNFSGESMEVTEDVDDLGKFDNKVGSVRVRAGHRLTLYKSEGYGGGSKQFTGSTKNLQGWRTLASSAKIWRPPTSRYKVRSSVNHSTMHLEINIDRSQVVEWPTGGQATLATFFGDASPQELKRHVVELFADDFDSLGVTVACMVDFADEPIQAVEVQTEYTAKDSNGETHATPGAFTFTEAENGSQSFDPTIIEGEREYRSRYRVFYDDGSSSDFTEWEISTSRALNVSVVDPGRLELEVSGASLNWELIRGVTVGLKYVDPAGMQATAERTFELTELTPVRKWEQRFNRQLSGEVEATFTYSLADDKVVESEPEMISVTDTLFVVPAPQVDILDVSLVPAGDWSDVAQAVVSLEYDAGDGRVYDKVFRFTSIEEFAQWQVLLRDPSRRKFRHKLLVTFKNGELDETDWQEETGDQAISVKVKGSEKLAVNVLSNLIDFERTPAVTVSLAYGDERKTLSFTEKGTETWKTPLAADGRRDYAYEITWHRTEGEPIASGLERTSDTELFIPRPSMAASGELEVIVRGFAVDFAATPFVDISLKWTDGDREERKTITLSAEEKNQTWNIDIGDRSQRTYSYKVTYNLADGSRVEGESGDTDEPVISVKAHQS